MLFFLFRKIFKVLKPIGLIINKEAPPSKPGAVLFNNNVVITPYYCLTKNTLVLYSS